MTDRAKQNARHALAYARIKNASGSVGKLVTFESAPLHSIALPDKVICFVPCPTLSCWLLCIIP